MELDAELKISDLVVAKNIAEDLNEDDLATIGNEVWNDWEIDKNSRADWEDRTAQSMRLALQVMEEKTFPWAGASNVKFPLVTIAALQYQARAYPSLIPGVQVVKARVVGQDPDGLKSARANRVSEFMSYQVMEEDECWEENMDKVLISQGIVGCAFKKTYFNPYYGHNVSEHVLAKDLYIPYFAQSLERASRITQVLYLTENDLVMNYRKGLFLEHDCHQQPDTDQSSPLTAAEQEAQGVTAPVNDPSAPYEVFEQHRWLDLDGDGYQEPYIVTVQKDSKKVLRIVARYTSTKVEYNSKKEVVHIHANNFFTKFPFIPSPDGGIYDLGFGVLLGPLNESINTILNQLVDAGTLSNTAGGFLGRGVKFRSGDNSFRPFEWKRVDSAGDDLSKGVFPLPVREPSQVLFQLLGLLIDYGERIGMAVDPLVGVNPGQNTPAETSRNMIAEGQRIFNAVFKRTYRALKEEFRKLYALNSIYLEDENDYYSLITGQNAIALKEDFYEDGKSVIPAADPNMISDEQKMQQAQMLKASAATTPGYNTYAVEKKFLEAMKIENIESIYPDPKGPNALPAPAPDSKVTVEMMKIEQKKYEFDKELQLKLLDLESEAEYLKSNIVEMESRAALNYASAEGMSAGHEVGAIQSAVALLKQRQDGVNQTIKVIHDMRKLDLEEKRINNESRGQAASTE